MKSIITILILSSLFSLNACSSKKIIEEKKVSAELAHLPNWVLNPNLDDSIAAVGISPKNRGGLRFQIPQAEADANKKGISQVPGAKQKLADIESQMEQLANKYVDVDGRTSEVRANVKAAKETFEVMAEENFQNNMEFAKKHAGLYGLNVNDQLSQEQIREQFGDEAAESNGFIEGDQREG